MKPGRIPCINPTCRRTAARDDDDETEIICGRCFRLLPASLRIRYNQLSRRERRLLRLADRRIAKGDLTPGDVKRIGHLIEKARSDNWLAIRYCFMGEKPAGLEGFLQEVGL